MVKILHYYLLTLMLLMLSIGARAEDKTVTFIPQLEEEFNIEIEVDEIDPDNFETIDMICEFISSKIK